MDNEYNPSTRKFTSQNTGRDFVLQSLFFQNGCILIITEGIEQQRIGALSVAISASNRVNVAKVIPSKADSIFINTIAERVSSMINGICIVSIHTKVQLHLDDMKTIMGEVMTIISSRKHEEQ
jgi:hypothetical protein